MIQAQEIITLPQAIQKVLENHPSMKAAEAEQQQQHYLRRAAIEVSKTDISFTKGQFNSAVKDDNNITISQTIPFPMVWTSQHKLAEANVAASEWRKKIIRQELIFEVRNLFQQLLYNKERHKILEQQDTIFSELVEAADARYRTGEGSLIEKMSVQAQHHEIQNELQQSYARINTTRIQLQLLMQSSVLPDIIGKFDVLVATDTADYSIEKNPIVNLWSVRTETAMLEKKVEVGNALPEFSIGYFNQTITGFQNIDGTERYYGKNDRFQGFTVGVSVPLWFGSYAGNINAARANALAAEYSEQADRLQLERELIRTRRTVETNRQNLVYYQQRAMPNAILLEKQSINSFHERAINHTTLLLNLQQVLSIRQNYLQAVFEFNKSIITLEYLKGHGI